MINDDELRPATNGRLRVGQAVALTGGLLAGMTGVVRSFRDDGKCLLSLDGVQCGVLLLINTVDVMEIARITEP